MPEAIIKRKVLTREELYDSPDKEAAIVCCAAAVRLDALREAATTQRRIARIVTMVDDDWMSDTVTMSCRVEV